MRMLVLLILILCTSCTDSNASFVDALPLDANRIVADAGLIPDAAPPVPSTFWQEGLTPDSGVRLYICTDVDPNLRCRLRGVQGDCSKGQKMCQNGRWSDCLPTRNPRSDVCDGLDNDCDGHTDEGVTTTFWPDDDEDGYGDSTSPIEACSLPEGAVTNDEDCQDLLADARPGADTWRTDSYTPPTGGVSFDWNCDGTRRRSGPTKSRWSRTSRSNGVTATASFPAGERGWPAAVLKPGT